MHEVIIRNPTKDEFRAMRRLICDRMVARLLTADIELVDPAAVSAALRAGTFQQEAIDRIGPIAARVAMRPQEAASR